LNYVFEHDCQIDCMSLAKQISSSNCRVYLIVMHELFNAFLLCRN